MKLKISSTKKVCDNLSKAYYSKRDLVKDLRFIRSVVSRYKRDISFRDCISLYDMDLTKLIPCKLYNNGEVDLFIVRGYKIPLNTTVGVLLGYLSEDNLNSKSMRKIL